MKKIILITVGVFLLIQSNINAQTAVDSLKNDLREYINKQMKDKKIVGLSIALVDDQQVVWSEGFGYADKENQIKATDSTIYRVGSTSKLFTSTSVMQLAEAGKIDINENIQTYIPEFKIKSRFENPGTITARNILTHHSGLPSDILYKSFSDTLEPISNIVDYLNNEYTAAQPNTILSYSNAGFCLLGHLVEKVSGESFYDYTQKNLLQPLDMKNSSFMLTPEMEKLYSKAYAEGKEFKEPYLNAVPAGMLHTNVLDLANFMKMTFNDGNYNGKQIIKSETLKEMQTRQNADCKLDFNNEIGLCWFLTPNVWNYAGKFANHGGDTYAYHTILATLIDHKVGVVVTVNTAEGTTGRIAREILRKYLKLKTGLTPPIIEKDKTEKLEYVKLDEKQLNDYTGTYMSIIGPFDFSVKKQKLITHQGKLKLVFKYTNQNSFAMKVVLLGLIPINVKDQKLIFKNIDNVDYMTFIESGKDTSVLAYKTTKPVFSDTWKKRVGKYEILNDNAPFKLMSDFELIEKSGQVLMACKLFGKNETAMALKPVTETEAVVDGIGRNTGNTISFDDEYMYFSGFKLRLKQDTGKNTH